MKRTWRLLAFCISCMAVLGMLLTMTASAKEELTFWFASFAGGDAELSDQAFWEDVFTAFEEEHDCEITVGITPWEGYEEKYLAGAASPDGPDVGYMYTEMMYEYIAEMNALADIDEYFTEEEKDNYLYYDLGNILGGQYALPVVVGNPSILVANMDILNAAGVDAVPTTWDELLEACEAVKNSDQDVYPFLQEWGANAYGMLGYSYWPYFWSAGGEITDSEGNLTINSEAGLTATEFLYSMMEAGYMPETATSIDSCNDMFRDGRVAIIMEPSSIPLTNEEMNWDFSVLEGPVAQITYVAEDSLVMFESCENKELAAELMKYVTSAEVMDRFHTEINDQMPITKDASYMGDERYQSLYSDYGDNFVTLPVFKGAPALYDVLFKNLQSMMLGDLTPQEVLEQTTEYYNTSIR